MSRRKIVVEGVTYEWQTDGYSLKIIPPRTIGSSRTFDPQRFDEPDRSDRTEPYEWDDPYFSVTPSLVARHVYRHFLGREMPGGPPRTTARLLVRRSTPSPRWATCPELPRSYLVQARLTEEGGRAGMTLPLEVHDNSTTARASAAYLGGHDLRDRRIPLRPKPHRPDARDALARLRAWLTTVQTDPSAALPSFTVETVEVTFKTGLPAAA